MGFFVQPAAAITEGEGPEGSSPLPKFFVGDCSPLHARVHEWVADEAFRD